MSREPRLIWLQRKLFVAMMTFTSMIVGIIFDFWGEISHNVPLLWVSATALLVTAVLSYAVWPLITKRPKKVQGRNQ